MLRTLFVLAILIPGFAVALRYRFAALLLYFWFAFFRPQDWLWIDISSLRLSVAIGLLAAVPWAWLACKRVRGCPINTLADEALPDLTHPLAIGAMLFLGCAVFAHRYAIDFEISTYWLNFLYRIILISLVAARLINTPWRFTIAVGVVTASLGVHTSKAGVVSMALGGRKILEGFGGAYADNNGYAIAMVAILPLMVAVAQNAQYRWMRRLFLVMVPATTFAVICTYSRGGFLALAVTALTFLSFQRRRVVTLVALTPLVLAVVLLLPAGYTDRLKTIQTYEEIGEDSALGRLHFWRVALRMVEDHPFGVGLMNYEPYYDLYDSSGGKFGHRRAVHSSHFQVLAETGYAGLAIYAGLFLYAYRVSYRIRRRARTHSHDEALRSFFITMANSMIASMTGFLVGGSFVALALNDLTWVTFGFVTGLDRLATKLLPVPAPASRRVAATLAYRREPRSARYPGVPVPLGDPTCHTAGTVPARQRLEASFGHFVPRWRRAE